MRGGGERGDAVPVEAEVVVGAPDVRVDARGGEALGARVVAAGAGDGPTRAFENVDEAEGGVAEAEAEERAGDAGGGVRGGWGADRRATRCRPVGRAGRAGRGDAANDEAGTGAKGDAGGDALDERCAEGEHRVAARRRVRAGVDGRGRPRVGCA